MLSTVLPGIEALRDVSLEPLEDHRELLSEVIYRRARHVVSENERVLRAAEAFEGGRTEQLGALMAESHRSLREVL